MLVVVGPVVCWDCCQRCSWLLPLVLLVLLSGVCWLLALALFVVVVWCSVFVAVVACAVAVAAFFCCCCFFCILLFSHCFSSFSFVLSSYGSVLLCVGVAAMVVLLVMWLCVATEVVVAVV